MAEYRNNKIIRSIIFSVSILICLGGCSARNVVGDFDCPADRGRPCIKIKEADKMATNKLESREGKADNAVQNISDGKGNKQGDNYKVIKFAPYKDKEGNYHQSSEVVYAD
ncbi:MAG: hypothetical protein O3C05_00430 [Proteobacteria bacterium]|nr:hypothetical protein [Pseudomonadota bacterium]